MPLVHATRAAYHGARRGPGEPRQSDQRPRMVGPIAAMSVDDSPLTRVSLLIKIRDGANDGAWHEFMNLYGPVVYGFARKRGLQDADAADLMQDVMRSVSSAIGRLEYDRSQGTFRGWLFTITRNKVFNFLSARKVRPQGSGDTTVNKLLNSQPDPNDDSAEWDLEYQRRLAAVAMERVKNEFQEKTWKAFWLAAVDGVAVAEVAKQTGLSAGAIYVAKSRVLARLKDEVEAMQRQENS